MASGDIQGLSRTAGMRKEKQHSYLIIFTDDGFGNEDNDDII